MTLTRDEWLGQSKLNCVVPLIGELIHGGFGSDRHRHHHHHDLQNNCSSETWMLVNWMHILILILPHDSRFGPFLPPSSSMFVQPAETEKK
jgi:hypothetical protein